MSGLEDVLYEHRDGALTCYDHPPTARRPVWCCVCGAHELTVSHRAHVAAAITAHLAERLAAEGTREAVAEALSVGEMTPYQPGAHPDHNRWSWRGDGHGEAVREEFREKADAALAAVRGVLGVAE